MPHPHTFGIKRITDGKSAKRRAAAAAILAAAVFLIGWFAWNMKTDEAAGEAVQMARVVGWTDVPLPPAAAGEGGYFMRIPREEFFPAEIILVSVSGVPRGMIESNALVGIRAEGSGNNSLLNREYIHKREETLKLRAPIRPGSYAIVGYDNGAVLNGGTEAARISFSVKSDSEGAYFVSLDKRNYGPSEQIIASVSGVPREMRDEYALMGIYRSGAPQSRYSEYEYIRRENERILFRAPNLPGEYEIRAFSNGAVLSDATMAARVPFTVGGIALGSFNVTLPKSYYAPGETMTVNVGAVPQYMINDGASLVVCEAGAAHDEFLSFDYIVGAAGAYSFTAPDRPGEYEVRAYVSGSSMTDATLATLVHFIVEE